MSICLLNIDITQRKTGAVAEMALLKKFISNKEINRTKVVALVYTNFVRIECVGRKVYCCYYQRKKNGIITILTMGCRAR